MTAYKDCTGYQLIQERMDNLQKQIKSERERSDLKDEETITINTYLGQRLDRMEKNTKDELNKLDRKIDTIETNLSNKMDGMETSINSKVQSAIKSTLGDLSKLILKWMIGIGVTAIGVLATDSVRDWLAKVIEKFFGA